MIGWDGGFFSHFPFLAAAIARTDGPILECGAGWGSTPLIHYLGMGRQILTLETDKDWLATFDGYQSAAHQLQQIKADGHHPQIAAWKHFAETCMVPRWGVVFLDQAPGEARVPVALALRDKADLIIVHDREADEPGAGGNYGWKQLDGEFKHQRIVKRMRPWTGIYSNVMDFPLEECDQ